MSDQEIKLLIKKRGCVKGRVTIFQKFVDGILKSRTEGKELEKVTLLELECRLNRFENVFSEFDEYQRAIELSVDDDEFNNQLNERNDFESSYEKLTSICKSILSEYDCKNVDGKSQGKDDISHMSNCHSSHNSVVALQSRPQLPSIPIPKFSGALENWLEFRDTFQSMIHKNDKMGDIEKFHFLRSALEGDAKEVIEGLEFSADNYQSAWELISERFNNPVSLVNNHLKAFFELPSLEKESASDLRKLLDSMVKHLRAIRNFGQSIDTWDIIIIFVVRGKLDWKTRREWDEIKVRYRHPTLEEFKKFLIDRLALLQDVYSDKNYKQNSKVRSHKSFLVTNLACTYCKEEHFIAQCDKFLHLNTRSKYIQAKRLKLCLNCLKLGKHWSKDCKAGSCSKCGARHHTILHYEKQNTTNQIGDSQRANDSTEGVNINNPSTSCGGSEGTTSLKSMFCGNGEVLLSTSLVQVLDCKGHALTCRALLDTGSQSNLISSELCKSLNIPQQNVDISIVGVNQVVSEVNKKCTVTVLSLQGNYERNISCLVVPQICESIPCRSVNVSHLKIPEHINLADPGFSERNKVDLLLGADIFYGLLCIGQVRLGKNLPVLQKTRLGWVISGSVVPSGSQNSVVSCNVSINVDIQQQLEQFWAIEEPPSLNCSWSEEDKMCEKIFVETTKRNKDGRFVVQIPLMASTSKLGDSKALALNRFFSLERRLEKNPQLKEMYHKFMEEYKAMGHMSLRYSSSNKTSVEYFLPHHGVLNEESLTTKLRVVFNGSAATDTGVSFNDLQYKGPTIQDDLISILLRFREYNVVVCADISKMYRMILVDENQRSLQKILWRNSPKEEVEEYTLNTVTYGTKSAPFLAIRCLSQLGLENVEKYARAAHAILHHFYVDDMLSGASTPDDAVQLCIEIRTILESGGFQLRKWVSNDPQVLKGIMSSDDLASDLITLGDKEKNKTLGLLWSFKCDALMYKINFSSNSDNISKRSMLSDISRIFDPLGLLGPCIITAKIILQKLWLQKIGWDEILPVSIHNQWINLKRQFEVLNNVQIPRHILCSNSKEIQIHGFSDASMDAYGGCVFIRSIDFDGTIKVRLMCSKVKVSPLKMLTIPRLELCGALVLVKLVAKLKKSMNFKCDTIKLWSDSTVVLNWIDTSPNLLQTFVGNRVSQIQNLSQPDEWFHVRSEDNPADILSRGISPEKLSDCKLWWVGPNWLSLKESLWPVSLVKKIDNLPEVRRTGICQTLQISTYFSFDRFSSLSKLKRTVAYCIRFVFNCKNPTVRMTGPLTPIELERALIILVKLSQLESFSKYIHDLESGKQIQAKGLRSLNPFLDKIGCIRVGGRLQLSNLDYYTKHPLLLSSKHHFTCLLFEAEHKRLLHAGPQLLLSSIREQYWPLGGRNLAKKVVFRCIKCFRAKPRGVSQIMGTLPEDRVRPMPPFYTSGVDYAGPFNLKDKPGRSSKISKCYLCLFVCFSTKAVHLELVSNLSAEAFIAALRRFTARRGKPNVIYSDNSSTFVGANTELRQLNEFLKLQMDSLSELFANEGVTWKFIPAYSPNFGGLWEAGVKSCKYHLKRILSDVALTFEQFYTLLTQIEATLNSRPLVPLSPSPNDYDVLTPSHFLIGKRLTSLPDPNLEEVPMNRLSKYQHIQKMTQHFWNRWSKEYITGLQQRWKWQQEQPNLEVGTLVLVREDNLPPLQWRLGRVSAVILGPDKKPRVALIKTKNGEIKRSLSKLCPLPMETSKE